MCCNFFFPSVAFKKLFCRSVIYHNKKGWKYSRHVKIEIPVDHLRETVNAIVTDLGVYLTLFMHCLRFSTRLPTLGCFLIPSYCLHDQAPVDPTGFIHTESWSLWLLPQIPDADEGSHHRVWDLLYLLSTGEAKWLESITVRGRLWQWETWHRSG